MAQIKTQTFGIEVEMTGITRENASKVASRFFGTNNWTHVGGFTYDKYVAVDTKGRNWTFMKDSSIDDIWERQTEMVSPVLGWDDIELLQGVIRELRANGAKAHKSCGIHVHVGAEEHTPKTLKNLVNVATTHYELLEASLGFANRERWCEKANHNMVETLNGERLNSIDDLASVWYGEDSFTGYKKASRYVVAQRKGYHYDPSRYQLVNLHSYFQGKGVEFRAFNSTLHAGEIKAYIQFCCALNAGSINCRYCTYKGTTKVTKKTMQSWLNALGLNGDEFKTCRKHLTKGLD